MRRDRQIVSIFVHAMDGGGAERIMLNLARGIVDRGYQVDLVLARAKGPLLCEIPPSVRLIDLKARKLTTSLPSLVNYLRHTRPDGMISSMVDANIIALWANLFTRRTMPIVISENNPISMTAKDTRFPQARTLPFLARMFYPQAHAVVACSEGVRYDLLEIVKIRNPRTVVIYNPVIEPKLKEKAQALLEHPWFNSGSTPVILAVGRLTLQKDFTTLLHAFAMVRRQRKVRLMILGEGELRPQLDNLVKQLDLEADVQLPGFVDNPLSYMSRAAVFVLSSQWEGLPTVLVEALFCGTRIVSTDCPSGPREILSDGHYGALVPVGDVPRLAQAIVIALEGKGSVPSQESWQPYTLDTIVDQYLELLFQSK